MSVIYKALKNLGRPGAGREDGDTTQATVTGLFEKRDGVTVGGLTGGQTRRILVRTGLFVLVVAGLGLGVRYWLLGGGLEWLPGAAPAATTPATASPNAPLAAASVPENTMSASIPQAQFLAAAPPPALPAATVVPIPPVSAVLTGPATSEPSQVPEGSKVLVVTPEAMEATLKGVLGDVAVQATPSVEPVAAASDKAPESTAASGAVPSPTVESPGRNVMGTPAGLYANLVRGARQAVEEGNDALVLERLNRLAKLKGPDNPYHLKISAFWHMRNGRMEEAEPLLRRVLSRLPDDAEAAMNLAVVDASKGDRRGAVRRLSSLLSQYPDDARIKHLISTLR
ncbi:MAG: tetratricopeptide repeat protein [Magnetococcus sp. WYHC-3]